MKKLQGQVYLAEPKDVPSLLEAVGPLKRSSDYVTRNASREVWKRLRKSRRFWRLPDEFLAVLGEKGQVLAVGRICVFENGGVLEGVLGRGVKLPHANPKDAAALLEAGLKRLQKKGARKIYFFKPHESRWIPERHRFKKESETHKGVLYALEGERT